MRIDVPRSIGKIFGFDIIWKRETVSLSLTSQRDQNTWNFRKCMVLVSRLVTSSRFYFFFAILGIFWHQACLALLQLLTHLNGIFIHIVFNCMSLSWFAVLKNFFLSALMGWCHALWRIFWRWGLNRWMARNWKWIFISGYEFCRLSIYGYAEILLNVRSPGKTSLGFSSIIWKLLRVWLKGAYSITFW